MPRHDVLQPAPAAKAVPASVPAAAAPGAAGLRKRSIDPRTPRAINLAPGLGAEAAAARIATFAKPFDPALVLIFASPAASLGPLAETLRQRLDPSCRIAGCSSAGELIGSGYSDGGALAVIFPRAGFAVETVSLADLGRAGVTRWMAEIAAARERLAASGRARMVGLVVADGRSRHEDVLAATLEASLPELPVIGGMGGNGLAFADVAVVAEGAVVRDAAILCLLATDLPFEELVFAHFTPAGQRAVVTAADPEAHALLELNAEPAAAEYARLAGLDPARLTPHEFARHPLLLRMGGRHHVRAISGVREDGGLQLLASIDVGTVLTLGRAEDLITGFAAALAQLPARPALLLGFDCILRRLALEQAGLCTQVAALHRRYNIHGFNTYGELCEGMHVNQTFVGMAFLDPAAAGGGDEVPTA